MCIIQNDLEGEDQNDLIEALRAMDLFWAYFLDILTYNDVSVHDKHTTCKLQELNLQLQSTCNQILHVLI